MHTSNQELMAYLTSCRAEEFCFVVQLCRSRFSKKSMRLCAEIPNTGAVPPADSEERAELAGQVVDLIGRYGSNTLAYLFRKACDGKGANSYYRITHDIAKLMRSSLKKKDRPKLAHAPPLRELEELIVAMALGRMRRELTVEETEQLLREAGLGNKAPIAAAKFHGSWAIGSAALPTLVKLLGKKTVTVMINHVLVGATGKLLGKQAATAMAKRLVIKFPQKLFAKLVSVVGWALLVADVVALGTSPARRITGKVVPFIAVCRVSARMEQDRQE
ncbi:MAG: hypothetical protein ACOC8H_01485 [bacterium]